MASINLITFCREEESQASQQGQIHLQDVPEGRLRDLGVEEPPGGSWALGESPQRVCEWIGCFTKCDHQFTNCNGTTFFL